jgi:hypothetical protein
MQIVPIVLDDYNARHGTPYKSEHLVDPSINVAIGCELLRIIIASYQKNHPRVRNLQAAWSNPRFVELLTFGWNAGFSEAGGVGRVARYLEQRGVAELTIDLVSQSARAAGASKHLSSAAKVQWCKSVVALYAREHALSDPRVDSGRAPARVDAPVTSPSQADSSRKPSQAGPPASAHPIDPYGPTTGAKPIDPYTAPKPSSGLSRRFDAVFDRYRGAIPIEYLRALVDRESSFEPKRRTGHAIGLMQIIPVVLDDYNTRNGTHYKPEHLVDPSINVAIGCELLVIIIASYAGHSHVANLQADWNNLRFVELLTFGWNAGFSEAGGVGRVARYLEHHGITDLTIDRVSDSARAAGASKHLSNAAKVRWCKSVVALYARERSLSDPRRAPKHA